MHAGRTYAAPSGGVGPEIAQAFSGLYNAQHAV